MPIPTPGKCGIPTAESMSYFRVTHYPPFVARRRATLRPAPALCIAAPVSGTDGTQ